MDQTPQTNEAPTHTSGPWTYTGEHFKHDDSAIIKGPDGKHVAAALDFNRYDREKEVEANAHLIAAAPELLEALYTAVDQLQILNNIYNFTSGDAEVNAEIAAKGRAAIIKAGGEVPETMAESTDDTTPEDFTDFTGGALR